MLNTLYPPTTTVPPTRQLTSTILDSQRNAFFRYITAVEKNGKAVLRNLEIQGKGPKDANGWTAVRESVDKYLRTVNGVIEECVEVTGPDSLDPNSSEHRRNDRRADSGVSFSIGDRPSTSSRGSRSDSSSNKPLPASPSIPQAPGSAIPVAPPSPKKKGGTTLEKIARELRNFRSRSDPTKASMEGADGEKVRSLKKMKSTSSIRDSSRSKHSRSGSGGGGRAHTFEINDVTREQLIQQAQRQKENRAAELGILPHRRL